MQQPLFCFSRATALHAAGENLVKPVKEARIMRSDDVADELAMVLLSNYTIKWRIQEFSVDILKPTIVAAKRRNMGRRWKKYYI